MIRYVEKERPVEELYKAESVIQQKENIEEWLSLHEGITQAPDTSKIGAWTKQLSAEEGSMIWKICEPIASQMEMEKHSAVQAYRLPPFFFMKRLKKSILFRYTQLWYAMPLSYKIFFRKTRQKLAR